MNLRRLFPNILIVALSITLVYSFFVSSVFGQIDTMNEIEFLHTGKLITNEKEFLISNEIAIREFFDGKIIRVSGITLEGYPYIVYTKIIDEQLHSHGKIFKDEKALKIKFEKMDLVEEQIQKKDDLLILTEHTLRIYNKEVAKIDIRIFDKTINRLNDFYQNYGFIKDVKIKVTVLDEGNKIFASFNGMTNDNGLFQAEFLIPENHPRETFTVEIVAENEKHKSSKTIEIFNLGQKSND